MFYIGIALARCHNAIWWRQRMLMVALLTRSAAPDIVYPSFPYRILKPNSLQRRTAPALAGAWLLWFVCAQNPFSIN